MTINPLKHKGTWLRLVRTVLLLYDFGVSILKRLADGDVDAWNEAWKCLYPIAYASAKLRVGDILSHECEDIAIETLVDIFKLGSTVNSQEELKALTVVIARNKATDRLRRRLAVKRGGKNLESLESLDESETSEALTTDFLDELTSAELRELLTNLTLSVKKKEYRVVLNETFQFLSSVFPFVLFFRLR